MRSVSPSPEPAPSLISEPFREIQFRQLLDSGSGDVLIRLGAWPGPHQLLAQHAVVRLAQWRRLQLKVEPRTSATRRSYRDDPTENGLTQPDVRATGPPVPTMTAWRSLPGVAAAGRASFHGMAVCGHGWRGNTAAR